MAKYKNLVKAVLSRLQPSYQYLSGRIVEARNPVNYNGVLIDTSCTSIRTRYKARFSSFYPLNSHSVNEKELVDRNLQADLPVVELGGGIGYISCYINQRLNGQQQIVVEPNPDNIRCNRQNRDLNKCSYTLLEGAYQPNGEQASFTFGSKFSNGKANIEDTTGEIKVDGYSLSGIADSYQLNEFTLVCDIEGGEYSLLDNEIETISDYCPLLIIEFHDINGYQKSNYIEKLRSTGYTVADETEIASVFVQ